MANTKQSTSKTQKSKACGSKSASGCSGCKSQQKSRACSSKSASDCNG